MKLYLLSDNQDALTGLRLAGIEGALVSNAQEVAEKTEQILKDPEVGILLLTPTVNNMCKEYFWKLKKNKFPLILEIPDSNPDASSSDSVTEYIRNAVGIKI